MGSSVPLGSSVLETICLRLNSGSSGEALKTILIQSLTTSCGYVLLHLSQWMAVTYSWELSCRLNMRMSAEILDFWFVLVFFSR